MIIDYQTPFNAFNAFNASKIVNGLLKDIIIALFNEDMLFETSNMLSLFKNLVSISEDANFWYSVNTYLMFHLNLQYQHKLTYINSKTIDVSGLQYMDTTVDLYKNYFISLDQQFADKDLDLTDNINLYDTTIDDFIAPKVLKVPKVLKLDYHSLELISAPDMKGVQNI